MLLWKVCTGTFIFLEIEYLGCKIGVSSDWLDVA